MTDAVAALPLRDPDPSMTPAELQSRRTLARRRALVFALNAVTVAALAAGIARVFGSGGWSVADVVIFVCFLIGAPWTVMGVWNALIGLWVLHVRGLRDACPVIDDGDGDEPIRVRVALTMFLRNEPPARALERLASMREALDETGQGERFDLFVLSDTDDPAVAAEEERVFGELRPRLGWRARYRRRESNEGWKAGNIRDFLLRWGVDYDLFLPLDTDSLMSAGAILRMTRIMQKHPRLGILQSLVVGAPSDSFFARTFQFGMRAGMRSFTAGAVWWHGDACAYWGHNALIRVAPFRDGCELPVLPGQPPLGGHILSHDQVEAALMRRAGYECRVLPVEIESFEENPPTILEFIKRDHRWCNGNMQYFPLVGLPGLVPLSRFQIVSAIAMYFGGPAWMLMVAAAASLLLLPEQAVEGAWTFDPGFAIAMFFIMFSVSLAPKVLGWVDVALTPGGVRRYGGSSRFVAGALVEFVFSTLMAPVAALAVTVFMVGLLFGKRIAWNGQMRDLSRVSWAQAAARMWPQTLYGLALTALIFAVNPAVAPWAAPMLLGLSLAIPFTVVTASPALGAWSRRLGLCATPEEIAPTDALRRAAGGPPPITPARAA